MKFALGTVTVTLLSDPPIWVSNVSVPVPPPRTGGKVTVTVPEACPGEPGVSVTVPEIARPASMVFFGTVKLTGWESALLSFPLKMATSGFPATGSETVTGFCDDTSSELACQSTSLVGAADTSTPSRDDVCWVTSLPPCSSVRQPETSQAPFGTVCCVQPKFSTSPGEFTGLATALTFVAMVSVGLVAWPCPAMPDASGAVTVSCPSSATDTDVPKTQDVGVLWRQNFTEVTGVLP